jgi:hypothetical protein
VPAVGEKPERRLDEERHEIGDRESEADLDVAELELVPDSRPRGLERPEDELVEERDGQEDAGGAPEPVLAGRPWQAHHRKPIVRTMSGRARLGIALVPLLAGLVAGVVLLALPRAATPSLAAYAGSVEYTDEHDSNGGRTQLWFDPVGRRTRQIRVFPASPLTEELATYNLSGVEYMVFVVGTEQSYALTRVPVPPACRVLLARNAAARWAAELRAQVARGATVVVDRETVHGRPTLRLRRAAPPPGSRIELWVDPSTYVPVRERTTTRTGTADDEIHWLPRTPASAALARPVIPAGRRRVSVIEESGMSIRETIDPCARS